MRRPWLVLAAMTTLTAVGMIVVYRWNPREPGSEALNTLSPAQVNSGGPAHKDDEHTVPVPATGDIIALDGSGRVERRTKTGQATWSKSLVERTGGVRPPHLLSDADRIYLTHTGGVTALEASSGALLWHSPGPADRMLLSGDLLLAAECGIGETITKNGRWVVARNVATGHEAFRLRIPTEDFDPVPIEQTSGLLLVQRHDSPGGDGLAILFDRTGREHHRFDRQIVSVRSWAGGRLVLTGREVTRLSATGAIEWTVPFQEYQWLAGGDLVPLPGGDMIASQYCRIADSGVSIIRFDPIRGPKAWETHCSGLGGTHSGYNHKATVEIVGDGLRVSSRGSGGDFVEILDAGTGRSVNRQVAKP